MADISNSSDRGEGLAIIVDLTKDMLAKASGVRLDVLIGASIELVTVGLGIAGPYMLKVLVDLLTARTASPAAILGCVALFVFTWAGANIISTWRMVYSTRVVDGLSARYVAEVIRQRLPAAAGARTGDSGYTLDLIERLPYSLMVVVDGLIWRSVPLFLQVVGSMWVIAGLIPVHYAAIMAVILLGYVVTTWFGAVQHQTRSAGANSAAGAVSQSTGDVLRNARRVVLNGALESEVVHISDRFRAKAAANERMMWSLALMALCQYGLVGVGLLALMGLGSLDVLAHHMTVGDFVLLQGYAFRLVGPLSGFGFILSQASLSIACIRDVRQMMQPIEEQGSESDGPDNAAEISLTNLSFSYGPGLPGLADITAHIAPGSFVVIVGPNGSGKSTLAQVMAGLMPPSSGSVRIDGKDLATIRRADRHRYILYVPQFIGLFNRTLAANALYPPTTQTEASLAQLLAEWHFYETGQDIDFAAAVGEQGERLSGGQIQKLELARIAGVQVPAIILDESTSALDSVSEAAIIGSLRKRFGAQTTLILISHHVQMAELADQVWFMKAGCLVRKGRHEELLADSAAYQFQWSGGVR
ncbi:ABC transporter ATP-binding protein [Asticcacaulis sp.]|uniref:ABC transporter ATP-binding protein n=1 Tax=Asticcacaulis sp. TaxID=1872648 RepID=UPI002BE20D29|nr:ABC transporter ATP-binding protein [Asticcacaulis sp.]HTM81557.1 ABC transporter ATP-binding protein [Asticcacaulis sp.]